MPDVSIKAAPEATEKDGWRVSVGLGDASSSRLGLARQLVSESMLLAGEAVAGYGDKHGLPLPYRGQEMRSEMPPPEELGPAGLPRMWGALRMMLPSSIASSPQPHLGLGLDAYVQVTSPIRRFADLAVHYQLKAHLAGEPLPFSADEVVRIGRESGSRARALERSANDYWLCEFWRRHAGKPFAGLVLGGVRGRDQSYKLLLTEVGAIVDYKSTTPLTAGEEALVVPSKAGVFL
uniref:RNB domain-containing protein n=1 Tax=Coccolithus braarudii TaxID=221442 RepID=A0A7S0LD13_9EUKA